MNILYSINPILALLTLIIGGLTGFGYARKQNISLLQRSIEDYKSAYDAQSVKMKELEARIRDLEEMITSQKNQMEALVKANKEMVSSTELRDHIDKIGLDRKEEFGILNGKIDILIANHTKPQVNITNK